MFAIRKNRQHEEIQRRSLIKHLPQGELVFGLCVAHTDTTAHDLEHHQQNRLRTVIFIDVAAIRATMSIDRRLCTLWEAANISNTGTN